MEIYTENSYEKSIIQLFQNLGYNYYYGPYVDRDHKNPLFIIDLENLYKINKGENTLAIRNAIDNIQNLW